MAKLLKGKDVSDSIIQQCAAKVSEMITDGKMAPKLAVVCVGESSSNDSYLKGIEKKAGEAGVLFSVKSLEENVSLSDLKELIDDLNNDEKVNGILLMRPLPENLRAFERDVCELISPQKDVDAARSMSVAGTYLGLKSYAPCTAEACIKILKHYKINVEGKRIVVIGRSLVVGKPVANMLINMNATVTICHSKSENIEQITKDADVVIVATGTAKKFDASYFSSHQTIIDAGIN